MYKNIRYGIFASIIIALLAVPAFAGDLTAKVDTPAITCPWSTQTSIFVKVCAGDTGAPTGFSLQWETLADFQENGWRDPDDPNLCKAWFGGYLAPGACRTVNIGESLFDRCRISNCKDALTCGTDYVFRAFAHKTLLMCRSAWSEEHTCSTRPCRTCDLCTRTPGYWKTHNPTLGCTNPESPLCITWPVQSLTLGTVGYDVSQLVAILNMPAVDGDSANGLLILAHHLIAAKLNIASGADGGAIAGAVAAADALIGSLVVPPVGSGYLSPSATSALVTALTNYNEGVTGPGSCN